MPRFNQSFSGLCEQNLQDTQQLKQRFLDAKNKRAPKKDKKQQDTIQSNVHVHQKFLKRSADEHDTGGSATNNQSDSFEPPVKLQCTAGAGGGGGGPHQQEGLTKFSVEIVQQLEFTTSAANSQPQQISTNVTVKAHTNASVKSDVSSPKSNPLTPSSNVNVGTLVECVKQEPDNDFADLDQCAAALEKDAAANGGSAFGGFPDLIGEDTNDEIITSDAFKDLISDISNYPEFMKDFDFEEKSDVNGMKVEEVKDLQHTLDNTKSNHSPLVNNQNYSPPVFDSQKTRLPYSNMDFTKTELSPAAQTLKQMAEQHQHKNQMGLTFNNNRSHSRSPYSEFQFQGGGDYGSPNASTPNFHKNSPNFPQPDMIKQEMIFQGNEFGDMKRKGAGMYKQQYSPYGSPNAAGGSPGYLPRGNGGAGAAGGNAGPGVNGNGFNGGASPRPPSGSGGNGSGPTLQISQAQQLHFTQQGHGHNIQVSAGQHLHLTGDLKGNVSIAAHQGMHFTNGTTTTTQSNTQNSNHQQNPLSGNQQTGMPQQQQQNTQNQQQQQNQQNMGQQQQQQTNQQQNQQMPGSVLGNSMQHNMGMQGNVMGGNGGMHMGGAMGDGYSMSQTQTINFTQQSLRQRSSGPVGNPNAMAQGAGPMGPLGPMGGGMGPRHMAPQTMEQKLFQQQQLLRAQAMQQHMVRPPPPDYKSVSGVYQPRFAGAAPAQMRRMPQQPMPPSGPMIRPHNMYLMQQQHINTRNMYPRPQAAMGNMENIPQHGSTEWRHLLMSQQQSANFNNQMRPNFQHQGFNLNAGGMQQLSAMQHQQMRSQQNMAGGTMTGAQQNQLNQAMAQGQVMSQNGPMAQMNSMSQQMMHLQQQQQNVLQQSPTQMANSSMHMQQSQSLTVTNMHQQSNLGGNSQLMNNGQSNSVSNFNSTAAADFGLEFLENLPAADSGFDQELLSSFDSDSGFNLDF